jgi:hypothetical protein
MAAYVLERKHWDDRDAPKARVLTEEGVKRWLQTTNDWHWYLQDHEAREQFHHLAAGIRDLQRRELPAKPDINIHDEVLLIGLGDLMGGRGPEWLYEVSYRQR